MIKELILLNVAFIYYTLNYIIYIILYNLVNIEHFGKVNLGNCGF